MKASKEYVNEKIKELEDKLSRTEEWLDTRIENCVGENRARSIANNAIADKLKELEDKDEARREAQHQAYRDIVETTEGYLENNLERIVQSYVDKLKDKLVVELARKAMNLNKDGRPISRDVDPEEYYRRLDESF